MNDDEVDGDARLPPERRLALQDELDELTGGGRLVMGLLSASMMGVVGLFMLATGVLALTAETTSTILAVVAICIGALGIVAAGWAARDPSARLRRAKAISQELESGPGGTEVRRLKGVTKFFLMEPPSDMAVRVTVPILGGVALFVLYMNEPVLMLAIVVLGAVISGTYAVLTRGVEESKD